MYFTKMQNLNVIIPTLAADIGSVFVHFYVSAL